MTAKMFEIRDDATFLPMMAVKLEPSNKQDRYLLSRAGYGRSVESQSKYVMLIGLDGGSGRAITNPFDWESRSRLEAHRHIIEHFDKLPSGSVIDVEFLLGERSSPKISESEEFENEIRRLAK